MLRSIEVDLNVVKAREDGMDTTFRLERTGGNTLSITPLSPEGVEEPHRVVLTAQEVRELALFFTLWAEDMSDPLLEEDMPEYAVPETLGNN